MPLKAEPTFLIFNCCYFRANREQSSLCHPSLWEALPGLHSKELFLPWELRNGGTSHHKPAPRASHPALQSRPQDKPSTATGSTPRVLPPAPYVTSPILLPSLTTSSKAGAMGKYLTWRRKIPFNSKMEQDNVEDLPQGTGQEEGCVHSTRPPHTHKARPAVTVGAQTVVRNHRHKLNCEAVFRTQNLFHFKKFKDLKAFLCELYIWIFIITN